MLQELHDIGDPAVLCDVTLSPLEQDELMGGAEWLLVRLLQLHLQLVIASLEGELGRADVTAQLDQGAAAAQDQGHEDASRREGGELFSALTSEMREFLLSDQAIQDCSLAVSSALSNIPTLTTQSQSQISFCSVVLRTIYQQMEGVHV